MYLVYIVKTYKYDRQVKYVLYVVFDFGLPVTVRGRRKVTADCDSSSRTLVLGFITLGTTIVVVIASHFCEPPTQNLASFL